MSDLFNNALGVSVPTGGGIADPRYNTDAAKSGMNWNNILLIAAGALLVFIILKKLRGA